MTGVRQAFTARTCALARQLAGWSEAELAKRSGLALRTIRNLELGIHHPRHGSVTACLRAFRNAGVVFLVLDDGATCVLTEDAYLRLARGDTAGLSRTTRD
jgi:transcriptional regulator with XRE-family HTH domain